MSLSGRLEHLCDVLLKELHEKGIPHALGRDVNIGREEARKILKRIYRAFESEGVLRTKFNDFGEFLSELTRKSYGLTLDRTNPATPKFVETPSEPESFTKKVDLLSLVDYLMQNYPQKYVLNYGSFKETHEIDDGFTLIARFEDNFWKNIFNSYDLYPTKEPGGICLFNRAKHSIASYLHSAHPNVHYLNIVTEEHGNPLCTAILMEANGGKSESSQAPYLIVEGVIGNFGTLSNEERRAIYGFTWETIKKFAVKRKKAIFINTCHSGNEIEPEEFVEYVLRTEKKNVPEMNGNMITTEAKKTKFKLKKPFAPHIIKDRGGEAWFTHYFMVPTYFKTSYSNQSKWEEKLLYGGEHYADTFFLYNKSLAPHKEINCPFFSLKGYAQGFEVRLSLEDKVIALPHDTEVNFPIPPQKNDPRVVANETTPAREFEELDFQALLEDKEKKVVPKKRPWLTGILCGALAFLAAYEIYTTASKPDFRSKIPLTEIRNLQAHYQPIIKAEELCSKGWDECKTKVSRLIAEAPPPREEKVLYDYKGKLLSEKVSIDGETRERYIVEPPESSRFVGAIFKPLEEEDLEKDKFERLARDMRECLDYLNYDGDYRKLKMRYWSKGELKSTYQRMREICQSVEEELNQELIKIVGQIEGCSGFTNSAGKWNPKIEVNRDNSGDFQITCTLRYSYYSSCFYDDRCYAEYKKADLKVVETKLVDINTKNLCKVKIFPAYNITATKDQLGKWESKDIATLELWLSDHPKARKTYTMGWRESYRLKTLLEPFMGKCSNYPPLLKHERKYKPDYEPPLQHYPGGGDDNGGGVG